MPFRRREDRGQALIEFALVIPLLLLLILGIVEFSFVWNSRNTVLFASRDASMLAAEGGAIQGTDCLVLDRIERDVVSPSRAIRIQEVAIYWADRNGGQIGPSANVYDRTGSMTCAGGGSTLTVPYSLCITYQHYWITSFLRLGGTSVTFSEATATRVEPQL
ncbi:MAG: hypothetical protein E6H84_01090 [Chloroflexi bacterium]|nr:MAG: hypothetical protein E6H84_01090 [Chloroflexota bacterium]